MVHARHRRLVGGPRRKAVLTIHIASALGLLGASITLLIGGVHAATRADAPEAHATYTLLRLLTVGVDVPLAVIALLSGVTLALTSTWRIFGDRWLTAKLALYFATLTLGVSLVGPSIDAMREVTDTSSPGESSTRWMPILLPGVQATMLLAAATLGVFKPGRRTRRGALRQQRPVGAS
jgi:MFS superfamily sulfate permease-like transporter